tara:strand:+ start:144 stop:599 length:456 start_codon:yes stop_codon:yes gene_type:complete
VLEELTKEIALEGHFPIVDVRDIARLHSALMKPGKGPRRFMFSGTSTTFAETVSLLGRLTGRKIFCPTVPAWLISPIVNLMDKFHGILPFRLPVTNEGLAILKWDLRFEDSAAIYGMGIEKTDLETTMADMVKWMHASGRIPAKIAGILAI